MTDFFFLIHHKKAPQLFSILGFIPDNTDTVSSGMMASVNEGLKHYNNRTRQLPCCTFYWLIRNRRNAHSPPR